MAKTKKLAFGGMGVMNPNPVTGNPKKISIPKGITPTNPQQNPQQMGRPLGGATQPVPRYGTPIQMSPRGGPMNPGRGLPNAVGPRGRLSPPKPGFKSPGPGAPPPQASMFDLVKDAPQSVIDNFKNSVKNPQVGGGMPAPSKPVIPAIHVDPVVMPPKPGSNPDLRSVMQSIKTPAPSNTYPSGGTPPVRFGTGPNDAPQSVIDNFRNSVKNPQVGGGGLTPPPMMKKGGAVKAAKMGAVKVSKPKTSSASNRGDGIAQRGKTKGRMV